MKMEVVREWQEEVDGVLHDFTEYRCDGRYSQYISHRPARPKEERDAYLCKVFASVFGEKEERELRMKARANLV